MTRLMGLIQMIVFQMLVVDIKVKRLNAIVFLLPES